MTTYTGITIGPIYRTMLRQRSTREFFNASYMISYITRRLIGGLDSHAERIGPHYDVNQTKVGCGVYPDRLYYKSLDQDKLSKAIDEVFNRLAGKSVFINKEYLYSYFRIPSLQYDSDNTIDALMNLNGMLDQLELMEQVPAEADGDDIQTFLRSTDCFLNEAFGNGFESYKDLRQIARTAFNDGDKELLSHSYVAYILADGDGFSKYLDYLKRDDDVARYQGFCKAIFDYAIDAQKLIEKFGGQAYYIGGDDMLFVCPILGKGDDRITENVLSFVQRLKEMLHTKMSVGEVVPPGIPPITFSFGINIAHYKYPMNEALKGVEHLLFDVAKKIDGKDATCVQVLRHSGANQRITLKNKDFEYWHKHILSSSEREFNSLIYRLDELVSALSPIYIKHRDNFEDAVHYFVSNVFNESVHTQHEQFFEMFKELIIAAYDNIDLRGRDVLDEKEEDYETYYHESLDMIKENIAAILNIKHFFQSPAKESSYA